MGRKLWTVLGICASLTATALFPLAPVLASPTAPPPVRMSDDNSVDTSVALTTLDETAARLLPDTYSGIAVGQGAVIMYTTAQKVSLADLGYSTGRIPTGQQILLQTVRFSMRKLLATQALVSSQFLQLAELGVVINSAGIRRSENAVILHIGQESGSEAEAILGRRFGPAVKIVREVGSPTPTSDRYSFYPHVRAGQRIWSLSSVGCTAGIHGRNAAGQYYIITAGHCANGTWVEGGPSGPYVGQVHADQFYSGTSCDCQAVGPITAGQATNVIYISPISGTEITSFVVRQENQTACYSGASSANADVVCNIIAEYPVTANYAEGTVYSLTRVAGFNSIQGDSGAPVYVDHAAVGVVSGTCNSSQNPCWLYTRIGVALSRMNLNLLTYTP